MANIVLLSPTGILMIYRNLVGPFDNLNIVTGLFSVQLFGRILTCLMFLQTISAWYIIEKFLTQYEYDSSEGIIECSQFFTSDFS